MASSCRTSPSRWYSCWCWSILAVFIYFLHHIAIQIQLPFVIASIANDLRRYLRVKANIQMATANEPDENEVGALIDTVMSSGAKLRTRRASFQAVPLRHADSRGGRRRSGVSAVSRGKLLRGAASSPQCGRRGCRSDDPPSPTRTGHWPCSHAGPKTPPSVSTNWFRSPLGTVTGGRRHLHGADVRGLAGRHVVQAQKVWRPAGVPRPQRCYPGHLRQRTKIWSNGHSTRSARPAAECLPC